MRSPTTRTPSDDSSSLASRTPSRVLDQKFQALIAQATGSQSPALNTMAFYDWMVHLMASPGKQLELWQFATQMLTELHRFAVESRNYTLQEKLAPWSVCALQTLCATPWKTTVLPIRPGRTGPSVCCSRAI